MKFTIIGINKSYSSEPLCPSCANAHVLKGFRKDEELVLCNFGNFGPRELAFAVSECTDYCTRSAANAPAKPPAGFIRPGGFGDA